MCRQLNSPVNLSANAGHFGGTSNISFVHSTVRSHIFFDNFYFVFVSPNKTAKLFNFRCVCELIDYITCAPIESFGASKFRLFETVHIHSAHGISSISIARNYYVSSFFFHATVDRIGLLFCLFFFAVETLAIAATFASRRTHTHTPTRQTKTEIVDEPRVHQLQFNFSTTSIAWPLGGNDVIHNGKHFWIYYYMLASRSKSIFAIIKLHKFQLVSFVFPFHFFVAVPCNFRAYDIFITQSLTLLNSTELTKKKKKQIGRPRQSRSEREMSSLLKP